MCRREFVGRRKTPTTCFILRSTSSVQWGPVASMTKQTVGSFGMPVAAHNILLRKDTCTSSVYQSIHAVLACRSLDFCTITRSRKTHMETRGGPGKGQIARKSRDRGKELTSRSEEWREERSSVVGTTEIGVGLSRSCLFTKPSGRSRRKLQRNHRNLRFPFCALLFLGISCENS